MARKHRIMNNVFITDENQILVGDKVVGFEAPTTMNLYKNNEGYELAKDILLGCGYTVRTLNYWGADYGKSY